MAEGRGRFLWGMASSLMALMANLRRDPKKGEPYRPSDFSPYAAKRAKPVLRGEEMKEALVAAFVRRR